LPVRDEYEAHKEVWEKKLSELLGEAWTFDIDPKALFPYVKEDNQKASFGYIMRE